MAEEESHNPPHQVDDGSNPSVLDQAYGHHLRGDIATAADLYWSILDTPDEQPGTRLLLAALARAGGHDTLADTLQSQEPDADLDGAMHLRLAKVLSNAEDHLAARRHARLAADAGVIAADLHVVLGISSTAFLDEKTAHNEFSKALEIDPNCAPALVGMGLTARAHGDMAEAREHLERAVRIDPDSPETQYNLAVTALLQDDYKTGFPAYESRWNLRGATNKPALTAGPRWDGGALPNNTLFLYAEQGLGDTLMFIRFAAHLHRCLGLNVTVEVHTALKPLLDGLADGVRIVSRGEIDPASVGELFDAHAPLMDVPMLLGMEKDDIPAATPYIRTELERVIRWRERLEGGLTIGIAWQGTPDSPLEPHRSIPLIDYLPLLTLPGVRYVSLQRHHGLDQLQMLPPEAVVTDFGAELDADGAFRDTAALMMSLDLIITSDTSIAHLAGALGRPAWIALNQIPAWHWGASGDETQWYPSLTLFRQDLQGDWRGPVWRMVEELTRALRQS